MKWLEIFYLMIFFNAIMAIFSAIGLHTPMTGGSVASDVSTVVAIFGVIVAGLGTAYGVTAIRGTEKTPMAYVYGVYGIAFQGAYIASYFTLWNPLVILIPQLSLFSILITFVVESIFVNGMIQMTTGGWEGFK